MYQFLITVGLLGAVLSAVAVLARAKRGIVAGGVCGSILALGIGWFLAPSSPEGRVSYPQSNAEPASRPTPVTYSVPSAPPSVAPVFSFNTDDKDATTNGNVGVAARMVLSEDRQELQKKAKTASASELTKKIYSSIGKPWTVRGEVYKVQEMGPGSDLAGRWTSVLMLVRNPNAPSGVSTVEYLYLGDASQVDAGQAVLVSGYLAGTYESQNAMGGTVEALELVGNALKRIRGN